MFKNIMNIEMWTSTLWAPKFNKPNCKLWQDQSFGKQYFLGIDNNVISKEVYPMLFKPFYKSDKKGSVGNG